MIKQYKTVFRFICLVLLINTQHFSPHKLALPKENNSTTPKQKITVYEFAACYYEYLFTPDIKKNIITHPSISNSRIRKHLLHDNATLSIMNKIEFLNNQSPQELILNKERIFWDNPTNFITNNKRGKI